MAFDVIAGALKENGDVIRSLLIIALTIFLSKAVLFILARAKSRGDGDDSFSRRFAKAISMPFYLLLASFGIYFAFRDLEMLQGIHGLMDTIFVPLMVLLVVILFRRILNEFIIWYASSDKRRLRIENTSLMSLKTLISLFTYAIAAIVILWYFGVEITPLLASLGIGGLAVALALQATLSNYFAGLYLASDKTIRLGEYVELESAGPEPTGGYVERMTWRAVWIRTARNNMVIIPNSKFAESTITNYDQPKQPVILRFPVGVAYSSDLQKVEDVTIRVAKRVGESTGAVVGGETPFVRFNDLGKSSIDLEVWFKIKRWDFRFILKHEFIKELKKEFDKEGIEIPFPCVNSYARSAPAPPSS